MGVSLHPSDLPLTSRQCPGLTLGVEVAPGFSKGPSGSPGLKGSESQLPRPENQDCLPWVSTQAGRQEAAAEGQEGGTDRHLDLPASENTTF